MESDHWKVHSDDTGGKDDLDFILSNANVKKDKEV